MHLRHPKEMLEGGGGGAMLRMPLPFDRVQHDRAIGGYGHDNFDPSRMSMTYNIIYPVLPFLVFLEKARKTTKKTRIF